MCLTLQHLHGNVTKRGHHEGQVFGDRTVPPGVNRPLGLPGLQLSAFFKAPLGPFEMPVQTGTEFLRIHPPENCPKLLLTGSGEPCPTQHGTQSKGRDVLLCPLHALLTSVHLLSFGSRGPSYGVLLGHARGRKYVACASLPLWACDGGPALLQGLSTLCAPCQLFSSSGLPLCSFTLCG